ncbi:hypothetical protein [Evansella halocellulosilytica]|uniref:hypothetical protein n=1 Tax=Evansella halocellulosilytica TaxID=2011013 RepID=UPI000BB76E62|nr:hypothetical protein [Evansella halocellulosilytica]
MKKLLTCVFVLSIVLFSSAFLNDEVGADVGEVGGAEISNKEYHEISYRHEAIRPHIEFYYELMIEKYHPELKEEWKETLRERETILKKLKEVQKEGKSYDHEQMNEEWLNKHQKTHQQLLNAVKKRDGEAIKALLPKIIDLHKDWNKMHKDI